MFRKVTLVTIRRMDLRIRGQNKKTSVHLARHIERKGLNWVVAEVASGGADGQNLEMGCEVESRKKNHGFRVCMRMLPPIKNSRQYRREFWRVGVDLS